MYYSVVEDHGKVKEMVNFESHAVSPSGAGDSPFFSGGSTLVAATLAPALAQRVWSIGSNEPARRCHVFLVFHGRAIFRAENVMLELTGPALLWLPRHMKGTFALSAGSDGAMLDIKEELIWRAIGDSPIAQHLHSILNRLITAPQDRISQILPELTVLMSALVRENAAQIAGGSAMVELYLGVLMVHLWRASRGISSIRQRGNNTTILQQYLQLVEIHYREHLTIGEFANRLGISRSHLHEACLRGTSKTPLSLVNDRLLEEACSRLETTELSVEQIGFGLGFRDPGYFNRFFKKGKGQAPGNYRQRIDKKPLRENVSFAAWP